MNKVCSKHPDRKHYAKGLYKSCYDVEDARKHIKRRDKAAKRWRMKNPLKIFENKLKYLYKINLDVYIAKFKAQNGRCKICNEEVKLTVDHNHKTGTARGLLCGNCNRGLGLFKEDPFRLYRAVKYLQLWKDL